MTNAELEDLPDVTSRNIALFQEEDDGAYKDANGVWWMTGWLAGKRVKRLFGRGSPHASYMAEYEGKIYHSGPVPKKLDTEGES